MGGWIDVVRMERDYNWVMRDRSVQGALSWGKVRGLFLLRAPIYTNIHMHTHTKLNPEAYYEVMLSLNGTINFIVAQDIRVNYNFLLWSSLCSSQRVNRSNCISNSPVFLILLIRQNHTTSSGLTSACPHLCFPEVGIILLSAVLCMAGSVDVAQETLPRIVLLSGSVVILSWIKYLFYRMEKKSGCLSTLTVCLKERNYRERKAKK